jgi:hypothetical protein
LAASTTPGHTLEPGVLLELGPGHGRPDPPAASLLGDPPGLGDALDVDDQGRIDELAADLDQQVGPPGQDASLAPRFR